MAQHIETKLFVASVGNGAKYNLSDSHYPFKNLTDLGPPIYNSNKETNYWKNIVVGNAPSSLPSLLHFLFAFSHIRISAH